MFQRGVKWPPGYATEPLRRFTGHRGFLFLLFLAWPAMLVSNSGPSMTDSVLLGAMRLASQRTLTLSDGSDPRTVFLTSAFDIAVHDGRIYSGVAPGGSVLAAPFYLAARPWLSRFGEGVVTSRRILSYYLPNGRALGIEPVTHFKEMYLLQIFLVWVLVAPLFALLLIRLHRHLVAEGCLRAQATVVVFALGLGSMALYYSSMYSSQALANLLAWHALLFLWKGRPARGSPPSRSACVVAGSCFGTAIAVDYSTALVVLLSILFTLPSLPMARRLLVLSPFGALVGSLLLYHQIAFGSPFATPYQNRFWVATEMAAKQGWGAFEEGRRPTANPPSPDVMFRLCFGLYKGLFLYSPILFLGLLGHLLRLRTAEGRAPHLLSLLVFLGYLTLNSTLGTHVPVYGHLFWGGLSVLWGPRHLLPVLPFLAWGIVGLDWRRAAVRVSCYALLLISCLGNVTGTMFSDVIMSTNSFGPELQFPLVYAARLLLRLGPRVPLLDVYGVDPRAQAAAVLVLALASVTYLGSSLAAPKTALRLDAGSGGDLADRSR